MINRSFWEKRKVERFDLQIETILNDRDEVIREKGQALVSRDISCDGVFLVTDRPLSIGTNLDLNFLLSQQDLGSMPKNERISIKTSGKVIRTDDQGMAVEFDKLYKISKLNLDA
ncbi:MAG: hypothetical protein AMJ61_16940 [Desulfobacterales bacterium SG8_35_2]|nr:MAG: hypothetical protein AMJ61_16940 [Desulfobacterales bacterium SG8_35_2]